MSATCRDSPPNTAQHYHGAPGDIKCRAGAREGWGVQDGMGRAGGGGQGGMEGTGQDGCRGQDRTGQDGLQRAGQDRMG